MVLIAFFVLSCPIVIFLHVSNPFIQVSVNSAKALQLVLTFSSIVTEGWIFSMYE